MQKRSTKNSQANGSLRENVSVFFITPLALISSRNVGTRGHLKEESSCLSTSISDLG